MNHPFHPLANTYPLMSQDQLEELAVGIRERGYWPELGKIVVLDGLILDGRNRYLACRMAGVDCLPHQIEYVGETSEEALRDFVAHANEHRRHLTIDDLKRRREERIERVAKRRREGASLRTIAEEEKISAPQVLADLQVGTVKGLTVEPKSGKVESRDGKQRPAKKPKAPEQDFPPDEVQDHPPEFSFDPPEPPKPESQKPAKQSQQIGDLIDGLGFPVPSFLRDVFGDPALRKAIEVATAITQHDITREIQKPIVDRAAAYRWVLAKELVEHCEALGREAVIVLDLLLSGVPYATCPVCEGAGGKGCEDCRFCGYVPEWRYTELVEAQA